MRALRVLGAVPGDAFDIYQTDAGYAAVTNAIQRQILELLRTRDRQLPELVEETGRSKPTLSSHHMKELLSRELIRELPHPTDSRRKVYRLKGQKVGSSDLPVSDLKDAVGHVRLAPGGGELGAGVVVAALGAAPAGTDPAVLHAQARSMGRFLARRFQVASLTELWLRLASFLEREGLARVLQMDLENGVITLLPLQHLEGAGEHASPIVAGLLAGVAAGSGLDGGGFEAEPTDGGLVVRQAME